MENENKTIVFGGGCFWCVEAVFQKLKRVVSVLPGYAGGKKENPSYYDVASGQTGHAEVVKVVYDPQKIDFNDLLTVFFATHDPTTPNRQGADIGTQYRSAIFYTDEQQKDEALKFIEKLNSTPDGKQIVTEVNPLDKFYEADEYHKNYYKRNSENAYCQIVINPKLDILNTRFQELIA